MTYEPRNLSYLDGVYKERERILGLLEKYCYGTDSQGTGVVYNYEQLIEKIEGTEK